LRRTHGAVVIAAAGNSSLTTGAGAPANCANVIGVAGTDSADVRVVTSNVDAEARIAASGIGIYSTVNPDLNGGFLYEPLTGTSMASPHVAGAAALVWSSSFGTSPSAVRERLLSTADAVPGTGVLWTYGRLNAARAVGSSSGLIQTVAFDDLTNPNRVLNGVYPSGVLDWGSNRWYLSGPWGLFRSNSVGFNGGGLTSAPLEVASSWRSVGFNGAGPTSAVFTFVGARTLASVDAYNGGGSASTITLSCTGQATVTRSLAARQTLTIATGWTGTCTAVTVGSSNGWDTNFDNFVLR